MWADRIQGTYYSAERTLDRAVGPGEHDDELFRQFRSGHKGRAVRRVFDDTRMRIRRLCLVDNA